jgi:hypothetical protein
MKENSKRAKYINLNKYVGQQTHTEGESDEKKTKLKCYKVTVLPTLLYAAKRGPGREK